MSTLVLLRHGHSLWNEKNLFTGWYDVDLAEQGVVEAIHAGEQLRDAGILPEVCHTSLQKRAIRTASLALEVLERQWVPVHRHWRLNERHYGALQGLDKAETLAKYGEAQLMAWRRGYETPPPPAEPTSEHHPSNDPRYADLPPHVLPASECLKDVVARMLPYYEDRVVPDLRVGRVTLLVAHGNSLRALVKHLDRISDGEITELNIPTGQPLVYELDERLEVVERRYLDPEAAEAAAAVVAAQARTGADPGAPEGPAAGSEDAPHES